MRPASKKVNRWLCIPIRLPFKRKKAENEDIQLDRSIRGGPTPAPALKALELKLVEKRDRIAELEQEYRKIKTEADALAVAKKNVEDEIRVAKELLEMREKELDRKDADTQRLEKELSEMQKKLTEPQTAGARVQELSARLAEKDKLLMERTTELSAARAFLTKVDAASDAEVVGMVKNLNTLISSASGALSDAWDQRDPVPGTLVEDHGSKQIRDDFGNSVLEQIAARNPIAVNLAIQMHLGYFIQRVTSGWGGGEAAGVLGQIYGMISNGESQTIASRWRTLTKRYTPHQEPPRGEEVMDNIARILMITRSFSDFSEAMESIEVSAGTEIRAIIEATLQLEDTIKTKIASSDMSVYVVPPGTIYAEGTMANEFEGDGTRAGGERKIVAGTMEIGLLRRSDNEEKVLRKPKVILEQDLVEPEGENKE